MAIEDNADGFGGALSRPTIANRTETVGDGTFADRAGRTVAIVFAAISDLGSTSQDEEKQKQAKRDRQEGEFLSWRLKLHGVSVSRQSSSGARVAKMTRWKPRMVSRRGLYRRVGALTR